MVKVDGLRAPHRRGNASAQAQRKRALAALMKFRLIINVAKQHFKWVEKQCGINGAQLWILWELRQTPGLRVTELAAAMAMHQSTISNLIDKMAQAMLIKRHRVSSDQRVVTLSLTDAGRQLLNRAPQPARGVLAEAMYQLQETELSSLNTLLGSVLAHMHPTSKKPMKQPLVELLSGK